MAKSKRMMETDEKTGVQRQFFPITHISAIIGLDKIISGQSKVLSVNGKIGAVVITKEDLGLGNVITELPYANEMEDGMITAEMYQKILNSGAGDYVLPIAGIDKLGGVKLGDLLTIDETGKLSAIKQTDYNFTLEMKQKLDFLQNYSAGQNITIDDDGVISAVIEPGKEYELPTASEDEKGGVKIGSGLYMDEDTLNAEPQFNYTAGANISISNTGIISAIGGGEGGGVSQEYVDQKAAEAYQNAQAYTNSKIPTFSFEKIGEV
ncbi:hypothetical protein [Enterococcus dongliensis]|uniref:Uncharacterized protein n=1 Tax=Enterococcus dongliensis TaxID=2559925 RepID=A0ABU3ESJ6_9ENTE|nr:hypothetical protein [Enterococcus dongliensis]MDT2597838.1 hypothetical protein [Enterococcus dongliensis]MDT2646457.1 hypothetical protein [Enterococcus dongliensis]